MEHQQASLLPKYGHNVTRHFTFLPSCLPHLDGYESKQSFLHYIAFVWYFVEETKKVTNSTGVTCLCYILFLFIFETGSLL